MGSAPPRVSVDVVNASKRLLCARGGRCFVCFLELALHGRKTPVPPPPCRNRCVVKVMLGCGDNMTIGAGRTPHLGIGLSIVAKQLFPPFDILYRLVGVPDCHIVILVSECGAVVEVLCVSDLTRTNVMTARFVGDGHIACAAVSALFPRMTRRDLQRCDHLTL